MQTTVEQLASLVGGTVHGSAHLPIVAACPLNEAGPAAVTFVENQRNLRLLGQCKAGAVVVPAGMVARLAGTPFTLIEVADPLVAFVKIVQHMQGEFEAPPAVIDEMARIHPGATVGDGCAVMAFAVVGAGSRLGRRCQIHPHVVIGRDCVLGDDVVLHPGVVLYDRTVLGHRVTLHAHAVVGSDGFGYRFQGGRHVKVPHLGRVEIGDDVEVGAGTTIDRGTFQATRIGEGTKIDNLVQIAHNCRIGLHNLIVSQVGIAGSGTTGDYVVLAGQTGVSDHVTVHDRSVVGARSGVTSDIPPDQRVIGYPACAEGKRIMLSLTQLPQLCKDVRRLKAQLEGPDAGEKGARDVA